MKVTTDRLNPQVLTLVEAQTFIRSTVKDWAFRYISDKDLKNRVGSIIRNALQHINIPSLRQAAYFSLIQFYNTQRRTAETIRFSSRLFLFLAITKLWESKHLPDNEKSEYTRFISVSEAKDIITKTPYINESDKYEIKNYGYALNTYHERYIRDYVKPTLDQMAKDEALDPNSEEYLQRRSTLRNRAEREVRYQGHISEIDEFRKSGTRLVICSSHANCSERCRPWQGRVYSLDGTSGTTPDGRKYVPLEEATNILTPNGKWYNGLLGFNCRHYLVPYKDHYSFPTVSAKTEEIEYRIDQTQRHMERKVREWRIRAEMMKGVDREAYVKAKAKATEWNNKYISYSRARGRAFFRSRTKVL